MQELWQMRLLNRRLGGIGKSGGAWEGGKLVSNNEGQSKRCPSCILFLLKK